MSKSRISRRQFLAGSLAGCTMLQTWTSAKPVRPRNILFIMTDQHNVHALGCYGSQEVQTPNMDRLAREGTLFERAFCQTGQCCPSRYSIWTGRYARSHGLYFNGQLENVKEDTIGDILKRKGYKTVTIDWPDRTWTPRAPRALSACGGCKTTTTSKMAAHCFRAGSRLLG